MPRPIWSGALSFGLVNVPVKLYSAVSRKEVHFHMVHAEDGGRIRQKRVCEVDGKEVPYQDIAKGYEVSPGQMVLLQKEELQALEPEKTRSIDIEDFVEAKDIDPVYFENAYHLAPDRGAQRSYELLVEAMRRTGRVGIARMVMRTRSYLCAIRPVENGLMLSTLLYADEVIPQDEVPGIPNDTPKPREKELAMAEQLIESLASDFEPGRYRDEHRQQVLALIEKKREGEAIPTREPAEEPAKVVSLMDALQKSLAASQRKRRSSAAEAEDSTPAREGARRHRSVAARTGKSPGSKKRKPA